MLYNKHIFVTVASKSMLLVIFGVIYIILDHFNCNKIHKDIYFCNLASNKYLLFNFNWTSIVSDRLGY